MSDYCNLLSRKHLCGEVVYYGLVLVVAEAYTVKFYCALNILGC